MRMYRQFEVASVSSFPESAVNNVAKNGLVELWEASRTTRFSGKALARSLGLNQICSWLPTLPNGAEAMEEFRDGGGGIAVAQVRIPTIIRRAAMNSRGRLLLIFLMATVVGAASGLCRKTFLA